MTGSTLQTLEINCYFGWLRFQIFTNRKYSIETAYMALNHKLMDWQKFIHCVGVNSNEIDIWMIESTLNKMHLCSHGLHQFLISYCAVYIAPIWWASINFTILDIFKRILQVIQGSNFPLSYTYIEFRCVSFDLCIEGHRADLKIYQ